MNIFKRFKDKIQAFRVATVAADAREFAEIKGNGAANTYIPYKERVRRKKRKKIAKASRLRNR